MSYTYPEWAPCKCGHIRKLHGDDLFKYHCLAIYGDYGCSCWYGFNLDNLKYLEMCQDKKEVLR